MGYITIVLIILLIMCANHQCNSSPPVSNDTNMSNRCKCNCHCNCSRYNKKVQALEAALSEVNENLANEKAARKKLKEEFEAFQEKYRVGFQACATAIREYIPSDRIVFDHVLYNFGGGFNPTSCVYTCPMDGLYRFDLHVLSEKGYAMNARIMKNAFHSSYTAGYAEAYASDRDKHHAGSNSVLLQCNKGDVIWVIAAGEAQKMYGSDVIGIQRCLSNFSGRLIAVF